MVSDMKKYYWSILLFLPLFAGAQGTLEFSQVLLITSASGQVTVPQGKYGK